MKTIDFVVLGSAGGLQRGKVSADASNQTIVAGSGQEISLNARQSDFASQVRSGDQLIITLSDGRTITIDNFFNETGPANRLFVSADGYLNEVSFIDGGQGNLYAQYGPTAEWGKWSPSDELIFLGNSEVAGVPLDEGDGDVSMLGAALLGGSSLLGIGAATAAGVGGLAVIGGIGGGGGSGGEPAGPRVPYVDDAETNVVVGGDGATEVIVITGGGEPGDTVVVTIGDETVTTEIDVNGEFEAVFEGENFPDDGVYDSGVTVTNGDGNAVDLDGPSYEIDTTPPEITFTSGTESTGDFVNEASYDEDVVLTGTGEAGATLVITIAGHSETTVVSGDGTWTITYDAGTFQPGEYTSPITAVTTDSFGNSSTYSETLVVDTITTVGINTATIGGDGTINGVEHAGGVDFTGTAQAGASVVVTVGTVTQTVTASSAGTWSTSFTSAQLAAGEYTGTVTAVATDSFGNTATASGTFVVDTFVRDFSITSTTGGVDGVINAEEAAQPLTVSGMTEPGSTVSVQLGGATATAVVSSNGSWTATFAAGSVTAGTYTATMTATATDAAGNVDTATTSVVVDTEAGLLTIDSTPVEDDDIVNEDEASDGVYLTGTADAGAVVTVTLAGVSRTVVTDSSGNWEAYYAASAVAAGVYTAEITAITTDAAGNSRTATDSVQVDTRVDNLTVAAGDIAVDNIISAAEANGDVSVSGTTEVGSLSVIVTLGGQTATAVIDAAGNWTAVFDGSALTRGTYTADVGVTATDIAGNIRSIGATVDVDTEVVPFDMTSNSAGADQVVNAAEAAAGIDLGGTVEAGSTVRVTFDGTGYDATVDAAGNWSLTVPAGSIRGGEYDAAIRVVAMDHVGNVAIINDILTIDTSAPDGPIIASVDQGVGDFRGITIEAPMGNGDTSGDVASVVQVRADGSIVEVGGDESTNRRGETEFEFDVNVPNGSHLIVNSTDAAGNTSGTYLVLDDESLNSSINLSNGGLGDYQIENLNLDFAEAANVVIDEASLLALSSNSNTLTIRGSSDDQVTIEGGVARGTQAVGDEVFNAYSVGAEGMLLVDQDVQVII
ncbi:Ig-like domain-containing protein [Sulfitobacter guttiformis]|uniref:Ig-like domain-containing protein n=1 Tax=Sulfitobacter guttiformis TaxID=74349 RepID=A0A420DK25_9RHOB|nr:Ig-like domain-containing protein [Sulfitobacter guttiformis]RKE94590.1 hypothetical protein C8N30_3720 [Sulfitobacter guttiformis]